MRRENGSALILTVMVLLLLGMIGMSALDTVMRDQQVAGFQNRSTAAFYAAEAGLAAAKDEVRKNYNYASIGEAITTFPTSASPGTFGDTSLYPYGLPKYYADPDVTDPMKAMDPVSSPGGGGSNMRMGGSNWGYAAPYKLRVVGATPDGAKAKLEAVVMNRIPGGY
jgi:type IV pilus assembly PilX-like protein